MLYQVAAPIIQPRMRFYDTDGKPLVGGKAYSFKVGTELFKPTYRDAQRTALNTNPVVLDGDGSALIYLSGDHVLRVYDRNGNFIEDRYLPETQMRTQFFDKYGVPLKNGKVWTYDIASTIKKTSYANADKNQPNVNPVVLDADGWASISIVGSYRLRSYNENGVYLGDQDFKRPAAKALTSRIYPLFHTDQLATLFAFTKVFIVDTTYDLNEMKANFSLSTVITRDVLSALSQPFEALNTGFSVNRIAVRDSLSSLKAPAESTSSNISISGAKRLNVLINNVMEPQSQSSGFSVNSAKYTN